MRLLKLEIRRVAKTRLTWILLCLALFLTIALAYLPTTFTPVTYNDEQGNEITLSGLASINYIKQSQKNITGIITPEIIRKAVENHQSCLREYGVSNTYDLPEGVYVERILPTAPLLRRISEAFTDSTTGMAPSIMEISPQQAAEFYSTAPKRLNSLMMMEQKDYPQAQKIAAEMYSKVEMPFTFYPGGSMNTMDYQTLLILLIAFFCVVIAAPVFASDYQTEADDILRCTKYGRNRLGITKIISALGICTFSFVLCLILYAVISNTLFGWECTKTSLQIMASVSSLLPINIGQLQGLVAFASGVSFVAAISATLLVSSKCRNTVTALAISLLTLLLPIISYFAIPGTIGTLIHIILPSGGIGLQNSYLYAILDFEFINIGDFSVWKPYAMLAMAIIEIPLFIGFTLTSYTKHSIK